MSRLNRSVMASLLLAPLLLLLAAPVGAQGIVYPIEPNIAGVQDGNGVYISDVLVTWTPQDDWTVVVGCEDTYIAEDTGPDGIDLWCGGFVPDPNSSFYGEVHIVRQAAPPGQSFIELKAGVDQLASDAIINLGQADSLNAKLDAAEWMYYLGAPLVTRNMLHAFQYELVGLSATITPEWVFAPPYLLAEALIRVLTPSM